MNAAVLVIFTLALSAALPIVTKLTVHSGSYGFDATEVFVWVELCKLLVSCICAVALEATSPYTLFTTIPQPIDCLPALLYFGHNYLMLLATQSLNITYLQITVAARTVMTALLYAFIIKPISRHQIYAVSFITLGTMLYHNHSSDTPTGGDPQQQKVDTVYAIGGNVCGALASIATHIAYRGNEFKQTQLFTRSVPLYAVGLVLNFVNYIRGVGHRTRAKFTDELVAIVILQTLYGVCVSAIFKRLGAMHRAIISAMTLIVIAIADMLIFKNPIDIQTWGHIVIITIAIKMYMHSDDIIKHKQGLLDR